MPKSVYEGIEDVRIQIRGEYSRLGPVVPRHFPTIVAGETPAARSPRAAAGSNWPDGSPGPTIR